MAFQTFRPTGRTAAKREPRISINKTGRLFFSTTAIQRFELKAGDSVQLLLDDTAPGVAAIKPVTNGAFPAWQLYKCGPSLTLGCKSFRHALGIEDEQTRSFPLTRNEDGLLVFSVGAESEG